MQARGLRLPGRDGVAELGGGARGREEMGGDVDDGVLVQPYRQPLGQLESGIGLRRATERVSRSESAQTTARAGLSLQVNGTWGTGSNLSATIGNLMTISEIYAPGYFLGEMTWRTGSSMEN